MTLSRSTPRHDLKLGSSKRWFSLPVNRRSMEGRNKRQISTLSLTLLLHSGLSKRVHNVYVTYRSHSRAFRQIAKQSVSSDEIAKPFDNAK